jgi:hypothetical protein
VPVKLPRVNWGALIDRTTDDANKILGAAFSVVIPGPAGDWLTIWANAPQYNTSATR